MKASTWLVLFAASACGRFTPVDEGGDGIVSGCLSHSDRRLATGVAVFLASAGRVVAEGRTDTSGCFELTAPSGRLVLVAHDFAGVGVVETLRLYPSQRLALRRTLSTLALNPVIPTVRGIGSGEALGELSKQSARFRCTDATASMLLMTKDGARRVDALTGELSTVSGPFEVTASGPRVEVSRGGSSLRPAGTDSDWMWAFSDELAFVGATGVLQPNAAGYRPTGTWYGTATRLEPVSVACALADDGTCTGVAFDGGVAIVERHTPTASTGVGVDLEGAAVSATVNLLGTGIAVATNDLRGASLWLVRPGGERRQLLREEGGRFVPLLGSAAPMTSPPREAPTFRLVQAGGAEAWVRVETERGVVQTLPFPSIPAGSFPLDFSGSWLAHQLVVLERPASDRWRLTFHEHLGESVRSRVLEVPFPNLPDYSNQPVRVTASGVERLPNGEYLPPVELLPAGRAGLEVLRVGASLRVSRAGAPFSTGVPIATLGLSTSPVCLAGNSLLTTTADTDFTSQAVRYDIARIFDELASPP